MPLILAAALTAALQTPVSTPTDRGRATYLYRACQALDRVRTTPPTAPPDPADAAWVHECFGYIDGWLDALLDGSGALQQRGVCLTEWTVPQLAHLYVIYLDKHKNAMTLESGTALRMALKDRFPCGHP